MDHIKKWLPFINYEIRSIFRKAFFWMSPVLFFIIVVSLFPLVLGPDFELLNQIAPCVIWIAALLAVLISIGQIFHQDEEEGFLDILLLSPNSLTLLIFLKITIHWFIVCMPLILVSPFIGFLFNLNFKTEIVLMLSLLLGTPVFCFTGAIGAALMVGVRTHGLLLPILIMPFYIPVLIFGTNSVVAAEFQQPLSGFFAILAAFTLFSIVFATSIICITLRLGVSES